MAHITDHAVLRYRERIEDVSDDEARAALLTARPIIDRAAQFGCKTVILGNGIRLKLKGSTVCTVIEKRGY